ncbi:MAG TPA: endonuclease domain-containing protein [Chitinophagaceae bacterium]|nr:endonuclease domain-containing protein [Chitinophagaceae bacterium]
MEQNMFLGASKIIFENAKELRKNMTHAESILWAHLKTKPNGLKFRRQHPLGIYIADFYCHKLKLVIELDGKIHDNEEVILNDEIRQKLMEKDGLTVIRFKNNEILNDITKVVIALEQKCNALVFEQTKKVSL